MLACKQLEALSDFAAGKSCVGAAALSSKLRPYRYVVSVTPVFFLAVAAIGHGSLLPLNSFNERKTVRLEPISLPHTTSPLLTQPSSLPPNHPSFLPPPPPRLPPCPCLSLRLLVFSNALSFPFFSLLYSRKHCLRSDFSPIPFCFNSRARVFRPTY